MSNDILLQLDKILDARKTESPETSYVASLYEKGLDKILKKVGEEATETVMAAKDAEYTQNNDNLVYEVTDLWFHTLILLSHQGLSSTDITNELQKRFGLSGHEEKANRSKNDA
ncbi:Phosphoribosyl-ATP pyrophosphatase [Hydrogenovibrio crunogenus]|uniref:Phosphoribosyl-ATP pyrophosphatase n=1 Tax=Hydrogenovibrio crunogenus TaxID=39765 RepID=A0A4P7P3P6_9GAMM|nr:phosphoribosyl-ATP diphosphatase [Hydrogenovibrio crunogenus]QBZ84012.1 Phosphoribosyl-ATP pyrophosphatase [Hydrogenovibrio crunogenus]RUM92984.1 MAG: phosphoribosyl-ATP diphosphatase [Thiomicrospira sp.]